MRNVAMLTCSLKNEHRESTITEKASLIKSDLALCLKPFVVSTIVKRLPKPDAKQCLL